MPKKEKIIVRYSKRFEKDLRKAPLKIVRAFKKPQKLFLKDFHHPVLHNHKLSGKYGEYRSINVTGDWRAVFKEKKLKNQHIIEFEMIKTHSQLYG